MCIVSLMNTAVYGGNNKDVDYWFDFCAPEHGEKVLNLCNIYVGNNYRCMPYTGKKENILQ